MLFISLSLLAAVRPAVLPRHSPRALLAQLDLLLFLLGFRGSNAIALAGSSRLLRNLLFFSVGCLQVIDDPIKKILNVRVRLGGYFLIELCLFFCDLLCNFTCFTKDLIFEVRLIADDVYFDILFACFPDKIDPLGNALSRAHICME